MSSGGKQRRQHEGPPRGGRAGAEEDGGDVGDVLAAAVKASVATGLNSGRGLPWIGGCWQPGGGRAAAALHWSGSSGYGK